MIAAVDGDCFVAVAAKFRETFDLCSSVALHLSLKTFANNDLT